MPVAEPPPPTWTSGPPAIGSADVISSAQSLLGVPYVWGGNTTAGLDCSAYVSKAWGISRQTTDTIHTYSAAISKEQLLPGDAMNLTRSQDPRGYGHIRIFAAWANEEHTRMWVYEETPKQSIYHAIPYDARYTPIRRTRMSTAGVTSPLILPPAPVKKATPAPTATPTATATPKPIATATATPAATSTATS